MIDKITSIVREMDACEANEDIDSLKDSINDWSIDLKNIGCGNYCELEDIRSSNAALRNWGSEMYEDAEKLENELEHAENTIAKHEDHITCLDETIVELRDTIEELRYAL